ncbi:DUF1844 domain-containing protein [Thermodesulforhabdus norvegica]|uniref:DUF1844 domain-containing protein n=1 Tax=Thermodesulforhabdus norvegica TaxID=39841 RepID=A0A1I4URA7_9BACT|nr:DUF1844 domain-containing protein [Thermodesulforhabdus norvegica]SFM91481.1 protein of unknown function [Thermodesulforhabdus norvegica]
MGEKEEKGFVFRDRRKIRLDELNSESGGGEKVEELSKEEEARARKEYDDASKQQRASEETQLPKVTFSTFIFSLASSALVHLGEVPDPVSKKKEVNISMARHIIDTLAMIEEKTKGNLDRDEEQLLKTLLYDLRIKFVQKCS